MQHRFPWLIAILAPAVAVALPCAAGAADAPAGILPLPPAAARKIDFAADVRPILAASCHACHGERKQKADLRLDVRSAAMRGGESGPLLVPGNSAQSLLVRLVAGADADRVMPPKGARLTAAQVGILRAWIDQGAAWPDGADKATIANKADHWAYKPLTRPAVPSAADGGSTRNPIDAFVAATLAEKGLKPAPEADRRTLARRAYYAVTGLPPKPDEADAFASDPDPQAYEKLIDRLLASPRYGEKWARHWLDVAHYGDTHGYDKDKVRPNAWPYRDYVIRSLNEDKPYARFVREQIAGDRLYPGTADGIVALGFIAAGPFDFVGQVELREGTIDKAITRNLDRDDMVATTMNAFVSLTVQCARCHDHKFDPIAQEDYYGLQAVFAAVDRADRPYDPDPKVAAERNGLAQELTRLAARTQAVEARARAASGDELATIDARLAARAKPTAPGETRPEFGYHSAIANSRDAVKWVQVDLGRPTPIASVSLVGAHDPFAGIGAGFGFPVRFRIEASNDPAFAGGVTEIADHAAADVPNPGTRPQTFPAKGAAARYVRATATRLALRQADYIFALGELGVQTPEGLNVAAGQPVTALDSIEAGPRWGRRNLVDGYYHGIGGNADGAAEVARLAEQRKALLDRSLDEAGRRELAELRHSADKTSARLKTLPATGLVYAAATDFPSNGSFTPTRGQPRPVHLLARGSEKSPTREVGPGTVGCLPGLPARFDLPPGHDESERRAALAEWVADGRNVLTWRSIVNRVWQYHFGRGIVETTNDFGRMGAVPTHPALLDWLAVEFRDGGPPSQAQSLKSLHRLILTSSTWRRSCADDPHNATIDADNRFLWRMNRQRLDAEQIHDAVLAAAGKLDLSMGGPGFRTFGFEDDHSPRYQYQTFDPDDARSHRRSVYRFVVRSAPDPFMEALDCADPSQAVARRNETLTALQALALLNNPFMVRMAEHLARRAEGVAPDLPGQVAAVYRLALSRPATPAEVRLLTEVAGRLGLAGACRILFNTNEFAFVD